MSRATGERRSRRAVARVAVAVAVAVALVAVIVVFVVPLMSPASPSTTGSAEVGEDGFRIELEGGILITAGADVAPAGTVVQAEIISQEIPGDFANFTSTVGPVVDITLGDQLQPGSPITLAFTFSEEQAEALHPDSLFVLGESETEGRETDFVESVWDEESLTLSATVEHLSWYTATQVDGKKLDNQVAQWLDAQAGVRTQKPGCVDEPIEPSGSFVLATPWPDAVWVCASETAHSVTVRLQSNSGLVYEILSDPAGEYGDLSALSPSGVLTTLAARYAAEAGFLEGDAVVLSGGSMDITYDKPFDSAYVEVQIEPVLSQISSLTFGASMLLPPAWSSALDWYSCGADTLETLVGAEALRAITSCVGAKAGGSANGLLSIFANGPGLVFTQIEGAGRTALSTDNEGFTVSLIAADAIRDLPAGAEWLFDSTTAGDVTSGDEDVANVVGDGTETAAYPFSTNHWVSCTDTPSESTYGLDGKWQSLSFGLAIQAFAPSALSATIEIRADGQPLWSGEVTRESPLPRMDLDVSGTQQLTVTAITSYPRCGSAAKGYGALIQAYLK